MLVNWPLSDVETRFQEMDEPQIDAMRLLPEVQLRTARRRQDFDRPAFDLSIDPVEISPSDAVHRQSASFPGIAAEIVQVTKGERIECRFNAPRHLLIVYEQGTRREGESSVAGLPRSSLRDWRRKLTFVPAGREFHEWQVPRELGRMVFFYFDPSRIPLAAAAEDADLAPKLFFENAALTETAFKLAALIEGGGAQHDGYAQALSLVLTHELVRVTRGVSRREPPVRGGLAAWQQRLVTSYIEEHLAEPITLATLARLARLSPHYFCRAFKQSFGVPPHRYHTNRRIERAKALLAMATPSVTDIGLRIGFSETSSFSAAFRKATGLTPTAYHRSLR